jgi:hypothetical protein
MIEPPGGILASLGPGNADGVFCKLRLLYPWFVADL